MHLVAIRPTPSSEDFGDYGRAAKVPSVQLRLGMLEPKEYAAAKADGKTTPGSHTANFAPDREPTIRTGVTALAASVMELLRPNTEK